VNEFTNQNRTIPFLRRETMCKALDILLLPLTELVGWLVMRDLRKWARSPRFFEPRKEGSHG
jgi:hypothetical protein